MLFINKLFNSIACLLSFTNLQLVIPGRTWILLYLGRTVYKRLWACLALYKHYLKLSRLTFLFRFSPLVSAILQTTSRLVLQLGQQYICSCCFDTFKFKTLNRGVKYSIICEGNCVAFENNLKNLVFVHVDKKATYLASVFSEIKKERLILFNDYERLAG